MSSSPVKIARPPIPNMPAPPLPRPRLVSKPSVSAFDGKITVQHELRTRFASGHYAIEQPFFQFTEEGYNICSDDGKEVYHAVRPRHIFLNLIAGMVGFGAFCATFFLGSGLLVGLCRSIFGAKSGIGAIVMIVGMVAMLAIGYFAMIGVLKLLAPKRRATLADANGKVLFEIHPTSGFFLFGSEFVIQDARGQELATFKKTWIDSFFQTKWHCHDGAGTYLFSAVEDSLFLSLLRRYVNLARFIPMTFNFAKMGGKPFGTFVRRYSLRDKYRLEFNPQTTDAWLMVATSILLDTGEKR